MSKRTKTRSSRLAHAGHPAAPPPSAPAWRWPLLLVLGTTLAYANSLNVPFLFDDEMAIIKNATIRQLSALGDVLRPPAGGVPTHGRPLLNLTLALNYHFGGLNVRGYHIFNLMVHLLNGLLVFGLVRSVSRVACHVSTDGSSSGARFVKPTCQQTALRRKSTNGEPQPTADAQCPTRASQHATLLAFAIAALWLLHPLCTEAVTYITQRAESLAALFYLLTLYALVRVVASSPTTNNPQPSTLLRRAWSCAAVTACALGMATKETMVTAPLAALLLDRAYLAPPRLPWREIWRQRRWLHAALIATWSIQIFLQLQPGLARDTQGTGFASAASPWRYLLTQTEVITHYLHLAFWPRSLCFDYQWPLVADILAVLPNLLLIGSLTLGAVLLYGYRPRLGFPALAFFLLLAPTSSFMPIADVAAERRMYLPLVPLVALVVLGIQSLSFKVQDWRARRDAASQRQTTSTGHRPPIAGGLALLLFAVALGIQTHARNADYRSALALWDSTVRQRPNNARAWLNRGLANLAADHPEAALADFNRSIAISPDNVGPYYSRGNLLADAGNVEAALADYSWILALEPGLVKPRFYRARLLATLGRYAEAIHDLTICAQIDPQSPLPYIHRAAAWVELGQYAAAITDYTEILRRDPKNFDAYHNRAAANLLLGNIDAALADVEACRNLGSEPDPGLRELIDAALAGKRTPPTPPLVQP